MPRPLNESEVLEFIHDMGNINPPLSPSGSGGAVTMWIDPDLGQSIPVLVYRTTGGGTYYTDISDLTPTQISALGIPAIANGVLYYLPSEILSAIGQVPQNVADAATWTATQIGNVASAAAGPLIGNLTPILIAAGVVLALIYLPQLRGSKR